MIKHLNRKDRKRWKRVYEKYVKRHVENLGRAKNLVFEPFQNNIQINAKYGWQSSLLMNLNDYEYRHTPLASRRIFSKVNIINHLCNNIFNAHEMCIKKYGAEAIIRKIESYTDSEYDEYQKTIWAKQQQALEYGNDNEYNRCKDEIDKYNEYAHLFINTLFYATYIEIGKMRISEINMPRIDAKGHCNAAAKIFMIDSPYNTNDGNKDSSERLNFVFAPVSEKARKKFIEAKYWTIAHNPAILLHTINIKSRIFELRFNPEQEKEYWQSLSKSDQKLALY